MIPELHLLIADLIHVQVHGCFLSVLIGRGGLN